MFGVNVGEYCLSPGSSGPDGDRYLQLTKRIVHGGRSVFDEFEESERPRVETPIRIERVNINAMVRIRH